MAFGVQGVEGVKELLLGALAAGQKLHVVQDQSVDAAHLFLEFTHPVASERGYEFVHEDFGGYEQDPALTLAVGLQMMPDGGGKMSLTQSNTTIDNQRIIFLARLIGDRLGRR